MVSMIIYYHDNNKLTVSRPQVRVALALHVHHSGYPCRWVHRVSILSPLSYALPGSSRVESDMCMCTVHAMLFSLRWLRGFRSINWYFFLSGPTIVSLELLMVVYIHLYIPIVSLELLDCIHIFVYIPIVELSYPSKNTR